MSVFGDSNCVDGPGSSLVESRRAFFECGAGRDYIVDQDNIGISDQRRIDCSKSSLDLASSGGLVATYLRELIRTREKFAVAKTAFFGKLLGDELGMVISSTTPSDGRSRDKSDQ